MGPRPHTIRPVTLAFPQRVSILNSRLPPGGGAGSSVPALGLPASPRGRHPPASVAPGAWAQATGAAVTSSLRYRGAGDGGWTSWAARPFLRAPLPLPHPMSASRGGRLEAAGQVPPALEAPLGLHEPISSSPEPGLPEQPGRGPADTGGHTGDKNQVPPVGAARSLNPWLLAYPLLGTPARPPAPHHWKGGPVCPAPPPGIQQGVCLLPLGQG